MDGMNFSIKYESIHPFQRGVLSLSFPCICGIQQTLFFYTKNKNIDHNYKNLRTKCNKI